MKILITGATGFIGQHLTSRLLQEGHNLSALVRPTSSATSLDPKIKVIILPESQTELEAIFQREQFDGVVHLASLYLMNHNTDNLVELVDSNIKFGTRVIDASSGTQVKFFINTGSFAQHYEERDYSPTNLYSATKQAFQDIVQFYAETTALKTLTLELFNTFGPGDTRPKIFTLWQNAIKENKTLDMSPGEQIIDISYIDNIVDGYCLAIEHLCSDEADTFANKTFALPSQERMNLKELSRLFAEEIGGELKINFGALSYRERETMVPMCKLETLPNWQPKVSLREGIRHTFKNHQ